MWVYLGRFMAWIFRFGQFYSYRFNIQIAENAV